VALVRKRTIPIERPPLTFPNCSCTLWLCSCELKGGIVFHTVHVIIIIIIIIYLILPAALDPVVYSASNRNEYRKIFLGIKRGLRVRLTFSPLSVSRLSRQCGIFNISQPCRPPRPVTGITLLYGDGVCFL
jgi:hypothetical protein